MIAGIGTDLVEVARLERGHRRHGTRWLARLFTPAEVSYCERQGHPYASYAARFAAKEAFLKALGKASRDGITWQDMEVTRAGTHAPTLTLRGRALDAARERGVTAVHLSLSHTRDHALAFVVLVA